MVGGIISKILWKEKGGYEIIIVDVLNGCEVIDIIFWGLEFFVLGGEFIKFD